MLCGLVVVTVARSRRSGCARRSAGWVSPLFLPLGFYVRQLVEALDVEHVEVRGKRGLGTRYDAGCGIATGSRGWRSRETRTKLRLTRWRLARTML